VTNTDLQGSANFSILGMPGTSYLYTMDGMNNNDNGSNLSRAGTLDLLLGQNEIQEVLTHSCTSWRLLLGMRTDNFLGSVTMLPNKEAGPPLPRVRSRSPKQIATSGVSFNTHFRQ